MSKYKVEFGYNPFFGKMYFLDEFVEVEAESYEEASKTEFRPKDYAKDRDVSVIPVIRVKLIK